MKKIYIILIIAAVSIISIQAALNVKTKNSELKSINLDENFLKNEMRKSVMEFIEETGINPDSCYIP